MFWSTLKTLAREYICPISRLGRVKTLFQRNFGYKSYRLFSFRKYLRFGISEEQENRHYFWYQCYAWGMPTILLLFSLVMDLHPAVPATYIKPKFGESVCWFNCKYFKQFFNLKYFQITTQNKSSKEVILVWGRKKQMLGL